MPGARTAIVIGGGPIGLVGAALLAQQRIACTVVDARPLAEALRDGRLLALSRGTWELLAPVLGEQLPPRAPIREVYVSSAGDFGATHISASDFDGADLGATVRYGDLLAALAAAVEAMPGIEVSRPASATGVQQRHDRVEVTLADGRLLQADVAIHAEGMPADESGEPTEATDWALLADLRLRPAREDLPGGAAFERFTRGGPLALLPLPAAADRDQWRSFALVWCMRPADAQRRQPLADAELLAELQTELGVRIGAPVAIGPRRIVPLPRRLREDLHQHRVVAVGNAAQTLHPVAGQGFNLGVRDCVTLADELAPDTPVPQALARYAQRRQADRRAIAWVTRGLPAVFGNRFAPLAAARGLGLALLDAAPPLRRTLAQLLIFGVRS